MQSTSEFASFWVRENMAIKKSFGVIELFYIPIVVVVTYICTCVKLSEKGKKRSSCWMIIFLNKTLKSW